MMRDASFASARTRSTLAMTPSTEPPAPTSMNGKPPAKKTSPVWNTFARFQWMMESPSVWARSTWMTRIRSPFQWKLTPSLKVTTGSARSGEAGVTRGCGPASCSNPWNGFR
jgi:hypothetical protein